MKHKTWKILLLIVMISLAILIGHHIVKANTDATTGATGTGGDLGTKLLGSDSTGSFGASNKLYANTSDLRVRKAPSLTGDVLKTVDAGTFIGTTTGKESSADQLTWVEVTLPDSSTAYVAKNFTYILS